MIQTRIDAGARPNIIWQVWAFVVLTAGETLVSPTHLEFSYTQGPVKLKSLIMCTYLLAVSLGNQFTAVVNFLIQNPRRHGETAGRQLLHVFCLGDAGDGGRCSRSSRRFTKAAPICRIKRDVAGRGRTGDRICRPARGITFSKIMKLLLAQSHCR